MTQFNVYSFAFSHVPVAILGFYYGALVDVIGRKKIFYVYSFAFLISSAMSFLNAYYLNEWSNWHYLIMVSLPTTLAGGYATKYMAMSAFITDITPTEYVAFRLGVLHIVGSLASPPATILGGLYP